jgi:autotransporter-associated beta strand protein
MASISALGMATAAHAQNTVYQWTGDNSGTSGTFVSPFSGNFSDPLSWLSSGSTGVPVIGTSTELDFSGSGTSSYTATFDSALNSTGGVVTGPFTLSTIQLSSGSTATETIAASTAANVLNFNASAPQIVQSGAGAFNFNIGMNLASNLAVSGTGTGALNFAGNITGAGNLTLNVPNSVVNVTGTNSSYTGQTTIGGGIVNFTGAAAISGNGATDFGSVSGQTTIVNFNSTGNIVFGNSTANIGDTGNSAVVNQLGGNVAFLNNSGGYLQVGNGGYGAYNLTGGNLTVSNASSAGGIRLGANTAGSVGVLTQTGGTLTTYRYFSIGNIGTGLATFTGGTVTVNNYRTIVGDAAGSSGVLNLGTEAGGNAVYTAGSNGGADIYIATNATQTAVVNLNSGTLIFNNASYPGIARGNTTSSGIVNLNGAVLQSSLNNDTLINGTLSSVNVFNGGAIFNISGSGVTDTVSANLQGTTGSGLYPSGGAYAVASGGGSGYIGAPLVTVVGGGGTGATAIAQMSNGVVTGVIITNPGQNYTSAPTFNFSSGGASTAASSFVPTTPGLVANATGGLTKIGSGILIFNGTNTYTGPTAINGGELQTTNAVSIPASSVISFGGGSLQLTGTSSLIDYSSQFSTAAGQQYSIDTNNQAATFATGLTSVGGSLTKLGAGALTLSGTNTFTGPTTITGGKLVLNGVGLASNVVSLASGTTLNTKTGSAAITLGSGLANVTVPGGATLDMTDGATGTLNIAGTSGTTALTLGSASGVPANLTMELGATAGAVDNIAVTGNVSVLGSGVYLKISPLAADAGLTPGNYNLITAGAGLGSGFTLATPVVTVGSNTYDLRLSGSTATSEVLTVAQDALTPSLYWSGTTDGTWNTIANWSADPSGTPSTTLPGSATNVFFTVNSGGQNLNTTLTQDTVINSLNFTGAAGGPVSIAAGNTLYLSGSTANGNAAGNAINLSSGSSNVIINAKIGLNASQTWTNNSTTGGLTVAGTVNDAGNGYTLTTAGAGTINLAGSITGATNLVLGSSITNFTGTGSYTGSTAVASGTVNFIGAASITGNGTSDFGTASGGTTIVNFNSSGSIAFGGGTANVGDTGNAAVVNQLGGNVAFLANSGNYLAVGNGGYGAYNLSGGTLTVSNASSAGGIRLGANTSTSIGVFTQTGGSLTTYRYFAIGNVGTGLATFTGGTVNVVGYRTIVGDGANTTGILNIGTEAGGNAVYTANSNGGADIYIATNAGDNATVNLNSGTLILNNASYPGIARGNLTANGVVNLNGAVLQSTLNSNTLINNTPSSVNVYNGGAIFNVSGTGIVDTVSANLLKTAGSGLYPSGGVIPVTGGIGGGYIGAPIVTVTDASTGAATGATAIANLSSAGAISGFTITSPGQNYSAGDTLNFSVTGGGASNPAPTYSYVVGTGDVQANAGGLTKLGSGTLLLTGSNTYTGPTTVSAGVLQVNPGGTLGTGPVSLASGTLLNLNPTANLTVAGAISGLGGVQHIGTGTTTLLGNSTYTGATNISAGRVVLAPTASLGNTAITVATGASLNTQTSSGVLNIGSGLASLTLAPGSSFDMTDGATGTVKLLGTAGSTALTIGAATGAPATLSFEFGPASADQLAITGNASVLASGATINVEALASDTSFTPGSYPVITASGGLGSNFNLSSSEVNIGGNLYNLALINSSTAETVSITANTSVLATAYWAGAINNNWNTQNGVSTNWRTDNTGSTDTYKIPGTATNVFFSTGNVNTANLATTLGANQSINTLTFLAGGSNVGIGGLYTLTIGNNPSFDSGDSGNGITVQTAASAVTISANVALGGSQTWLSNSSNAFNVSGSVSGPATSTLTVGPGTGAVTLSGSNTFAGGLNAAGGTLNLNNANALGTGTFTVTGPVVIDNTSGSAETLTVPQQVWSNSFTFNGSNSLNTGSGAITLGNSVTLTHNGANPAAVLTVGGTMTDNGAGYILTTAGPGTINLASAIGGNIGIVAAGPGAVNLTGSSSFAGNLNVSGGTLNATGTASYNGGGALLVAVGSNITAVTNFNTSGTMTFNTAAAAGYGSGTAGAINQYNGTLNLTPNGSLLALGGAGYLELGVNPGTSIASYGSYVMAGGVLNTLGATGIRVGDGGVGVFTQTGGTINISRYFATTSPGNGANSGGESACTFVGGTLNVSSGYNIRVQDNSSGVSLFSVGTLAGGNAQILDAATGNGGGIEVTDGNSDAGGAGILNLNHGLVQLQSAIYKGAVGSGGRGTGAFVNLNGATIQAGANNVVLMDNSPDAVQIYNGGAIFDTNGFNATVSTNLAGATGNGFYTATIPIPAGQGGSGYIGSPYVSVTGGSGISSNNGYVGYSATAIANVSNGTITSVTLTNPGQGYQVGDQLQFAFSQGTGLTNSSGAGTFNYTVTANDLVANNGGQVTKVGTGALTLSGSSSYTAGTLVKAGTIVAGNTNAFGTGPVTLFNNTKLQLSVLTAGSSFSGWNLNNNGNFAPVLTNSNSNLQLTAPAGSIANSAFNTTPVTISDSTGFEVSFTYNHIVTGGKGASADGITFTIQNDPRGASADGGTGGSLGYTSDGTLGSITNSVAAGVDIYHDQLYTGENGVFQNSSGTGTAPFISGYTSSNVLVTYLNGTLTETITSNTNGASYTLVTTGVDVAQLLGGTAGGSGTGYVGFTGGTGAVSDTQIISNYFFSPNANGPLGNVTSTAIPISNAVVVNAASSATVQLSQLVPNALGTVGPITIGTGGSLAVTIGANVPTGVLHGALVTPSITFASATSGTLDIANNALDIQNQASTPSASLLAVNAMVRSAYNNGTWTGPGITSTNAAQDPAHLTAVGVILNDNGSGSMLYGSGGSISSTFDGATPNDGDVLVKYTYYGDTNLDGVVDGTDYARIDFAYQNNLTADPGSQLTGWFNGDFNYDGVIDGSDYTLMDNAFNQQGASLASSIAPSATATAQISGTAAVPEPTTLSVLALGAVGLLSRRRRTQAFGH